MAQSDPDRNNAYAPDHRLEALPSPKRVRVMLSGRFIADSRRVLLLREPGQVPVYLFPAADVASDALESSAKTDRSLTKGDLRYWHVRTGNTRRENAAWACPDARIAGLSLAEYRAFEWNAMDAWFEEEEEVFVHPRDPFTRVDVLQGSRHVEVVHQGITVADSHRPVLLFETGLPTRYYLPKLDVRLDLLVPSTTVTRCPYKGETRYYSMVAGRARADDLFWTYPYPTTEVAPIAGLFSFLAERIDTLLLDGEPQPVPDSPWSQGAD